MSVNLVNCFFDKKFNKCNRILYHLIDYVKDFLDICMNINLRDHIERNEFSDFKKLLYLFSINECSNKKSLLEYFLNNCEIPEYIEIDYKVFEYCYDELVTPIMLIILDSININSTLNNIITKLLKTINIPYLLTKLNHIIQKYNDAISINDEDEYIGNLINTINKQNELLTLLLTLNTPFEYITSKIFLEDDTLEETSYDLEELKKIIIIKPKLNNNL